MIASLNPVTSSAPASIRDLPTPSALLDGSRLDRNIARMQAQANRLGVRLRPHVKTAKSLPVARRQIECGASGITVSTLKEAEQFHAAGVTDILYAVGVAPNKFGAVLDLRRRGCNLKLVTDSLDIAGALAGYGRAHGHHFELLIEIDSDGHRAGVRPDDPLLLQIAAALEAGGREAGGGALLAGVMTHAGGSYELDTEAALVRMAEQERSRCVDAARRLREAGHACPIVSVGSTPTALSAVSLDGVTELRAGVYVFFDLVMANVGVCALDDIAMSVLTSVIGHQPSKGWAIVDAGWMAMSRDRGTQSQRRDYGYGQVCDAHGKPIDGLVLHAANQEHGIVGFADAAAGAGGEDIRRLLPVGTLLRILPNHACATATQFDRYHLLDEAGGIDVWPRFSGW